MGEGIRIDDRWEREGGSPPRAQPKTAQGHHNWILAGGTQAWILERSRPHDHGFVGGRTDVVHNVQARRQHSPRGRRRARIVQKTSWTRKHTPSNRGPSVHGISTEFKREHEGIRMKPASERRQTPRERQNVPRKCHQTRSRARRRSMEADRILHVQIRGQGTPLSTWLRSTAATRGQSRGHWTSSKSRREPRFVFLRCGRFYRRTLCQGYG